MITTEFILLLLNISLIGKLTKKGVANAEEIMVRKMKVIYYLQKKFSHPHNNGTRVANNFYTLLLDSGYCYCVK